MADIQWPKADRVERRDDMSSTGKLTVMLQRDGDVVVNVSKGETVKDWESATVEFCAGGGGGGRSMRTREALIALMVAIEADNAERPIHDASGVQASPAVSTPYQFWLIERGPNEGVSQHQWWNEGPDGGVMGWKTSVHEATRYPSKEAAERVVSANRGLRDLPTSVTSHSFVDAADGVLVVDDQPNGPQSPLEQKEGPA